MDEQSANRRQRWVDLDAEELFPQDDAPGAADEAGGLDEAQACAQAAWQDEADAPEAEAYRREAEADERARAARAVQPSDAREEPQDEGTPFKQHIVWGDPYLDEEEEAPPSRLELWWAAWWAARWAWFSGTGLYRVLEKAFQFMTDNRVSKWMDRFTYVRRLPPELQDTRRRSVRLRAAWRGFLARGGAAWIKIRVSALLVGLAALLLVRERSAAMAWMCAGMGFSWLGDAMLMQYPPIRRAVRQYFLWGMGFFALAQGMYLMGLWTAYWRVGSQVTWPVWLLCGVYCLVALGELCWMVLPNRGQPLALRLGALVYALLLSLMAGLAAAVCVATRGRAWALLLGGLSFFVSDMLIALTDYGSLRLKHRDFWIWATYAPAQLLLLLGMAAL